MIQFNERSMAKAKRELEYMRYARVSPALRVVRERLNDPNFTPRVTEQRTRPRIPAKFVALIASVEERHGLPKGSIFTDSNVRLFIEARREAFVLLRGTGLSYPYIGFIFGMHHTTVLHHIRAAKELSWVKALACSNVSG